MIRPFQGATRSTIAIANATSASTPADLPQESDTVVLFNSSASAIAFFRCESVTTPGAGGSSAVAPTPGALGGFPIPPNTQVRIGVGLGYKRFSVIASAADGTLYITPGTGN